MEPGVSVLLRDGFEDPTLHLVLSLNSKASWLIFKCEAYPFGLLSNSCCSSFEYDPWTCGAVYSLPEDLFQPPI